MAAECGKGGKVGEFEMWFKVLESERWTEHPAHLDILEQNAIRESCQLHQLLPCGLQSSLFVSASSVCTLRFSGELSLQRLTTAHFLATLLLSF